MHLIEISDAASFLKRSQVFLTAAEAENNLLLSSAMTLARSNSGRVPHISFFVCEEQNKITSAAMNVNGRRLLLSQCSIETASFMGTQFTERGITPQSLFGPAAPVEAFRDAQGALLPLHARHRIMRLTHLLESTPAQGLFRVAKEKDLKTVIRWSSQLANESRIKETPKESEEIARRYVENRQLFLWEDHGVVAMAGFGGLTPNGARVNMVYTESQHRGKGFARSLVQAVSRKILASQKKHCFLFVENENAPAIHIYEKMGYETVGELAEFRA